MCALSLFGLAFFLLFFRMFEMQADSKIEHASTTASTAAAAMATTTGSGAAHDTSNAPLLPPSAFALVSSTDNNGAFYVIGCFPYQAAPAGKKATKEKKEKGPLYDVAVLCVRTNGEIRDGDRLIRQNERVVRSFIEAMQ